MDNKQYDYIIAGGGCAGLSLAYYISKSTLLANKSILIIDKQMDKVNDRTWCFWESLEDLDIQGLVSKKWSRLKVSGSLFERCYHTTPFVYNKIKGIDFYQHVLQQLKQCQNICFLEKNIDSFGEDGKVMIGDDAYYGGYVFNSILGYQPNNLNSINHEIEAQLFDTPFLWQQFVGYKIQFEETIVDEQVATWMDFNVPQFNDTAFMYVLPENNKVALFEYTLFSKTILSKASFHESILNYLDQHYPGISYTIIEKEEGAIPMSSIHTQKSKQLIPIGTMGGVVKPSTGFAFSFIQKHSRLIVNALEKNQIPLIAIHSSVFRFFDKVFINVLSKRMMKGSDVFVRIFKSNDIQTVFKFLSNQSTWKENISIMLSLPKRLFLISAIEVLFKQD